MGHVKAFCPNLGFGHSSAYSQSYSSGDVDEIEEGLTVPLSLDSSSAANILSSEERVIKF